VGNAVEVSLPLGLVGIRAAMPIFSVLQRREESGIEGLC
jgi:hypothetical protein